MKKIMVIVTILVCMIVTGMSLYARKNYEDKIEYERMNDRRYHLYVWDEDIVLMRLNYYELQWCEKYMNEKEPLEMWGLLDWDKVDVYDKEMNWYVTFGYYVNKDNWI